MHKNLKQLLSVLLVLTLLGTLLVPAVSAAPDAEPKAAESSHKVDPATLNIPRLGLIDESAQPDLEQAPYGLNDLVRVSILLEEPSAMDAGFALDGIAFNEEAVSYQAKLRSQQDALQAKIEAATGEKLNVHWNLTLLLNAISAELRYGDIAKVEALPGVQKVALENQYEPQTDEAAEPNTANTSEDMVGAGSAWAAGYTGAGSRIAIIDTGLDTSHQSVNADAFDHAIASLDKSVSLFTQSDLSSVRSQLSGKGNWISTKIPFGYNYIDNNTTVTHLNDTQGEHGSHVAGIAAANRFIKQGSSYVDAASTVHAVGMAPDAQLFVMKVFGSGGGAYDSDYMVAIQDAILLGCDSVNLSLGSAAPGFTYDSTYQNVLNSLASASNEKMVVSISAGNNGGFTDALETDLYIQNVHMHSGGNPGTFVNSLTVASADNTGATGTALTYNGSQNVYYSETDSTGAKMATVAGTYSYVYIDGIGESAEYSAVNSAISLNGKIVMVNRGSLSFYEKGNNLKSYSPKAMVVANNQPGVINMALDDYTGTFPMVSILLSDAETIKANSTVHTAGSYTYYTGTVTVQANTTHSIVSDNAEMSDFSAWGIPGSLLMKPEITAPGGNIYSIFGTNKTSSGTAGGSTQYEIMSGTSMAAPHVAGLNGVLAQFIRENNLSVEGYSTRALSQSLLMSTAEPMHIGSADGVYYPIIRQGAGLINVYQALSASSAIFMGEDATLSYADGKVKAELGDKPERSGEYSFSFDIHNLADVAQTYDLRTDLFTQANYEADGYRFMSPETDTLNWNVRYAWDDAEPETHDVNLDGETDEQDAQAILDYLAGNAQAAELDLAAADLDGDGAVSSRDAYLLLDWNPETATGDLVIPAGASKTVTVTIEIPENNEDFDALYPAGAYVEGFTYVESRTLTGDGAKLDVVHSIPILGFYGSWTDPSMFDNMSYIDTLYGETRIPYSGVSDTNYLSYTLNGATKKFSGNPYVAEEPFPAERLAINSAANLRSITYNLIRSAGTTALAVSKVDAEGKVLSVLSSSVSGTDVIGQWYNANSATPSWQNTATKTTSINKTVSSYGVSAGDRIRVGFYAIPEYYGMLLASDKTASSAGHLTAASLNSLLTQNLLGKGAFVGYDLWVDNSAPQILNAAFNEEEGTVTVQVQDDCYVAFLAITDSTGNTVYASVVPKQDGPNELITQSFDVSALDTANGITVFAGDYAANENAILLSSGSGPAVRQVPYYVLTNSLSAGGEYIISNANSAGTGYALTSQGTNYLVTTTAVTIVNDEHGTYIPASAAQDKFLWTTASGVTFTNKSDGGYLGYYQTNQPFANWADSTNGDSFSYSSNRLRVVNANYMAWYNSNFYYRTSRYATNIYLYKLDYYEEEYDPSQAEAVTLSTNAATLVLGVDESLALTANVTPITIADRSVTWSSSNSDVASVSSSGLVTPLRVGTAIITAESNQTPGVKATCTINVVTGNPLNATVNAQVTDAEGAKFVTIDLNDMSITKLGDAETLVAGGRGGDLIWGWDSAYNYYSFDTANSYAENLAFQLNSTYAPLDGANLPTFTVTDSGTSYSFDYALVGGASNGWLLFFVNDEDGSLSYFDMSDAGGPYVAIAFVGYYNDTSNNRTYYYFYALGSDGMLYILAPYGTVSNGEQGLSLQYGELGQVAGLTVSGELTDYSMTIYSGGSDNVFLADNSKKAIYNVAIDSDNDTVVAEYVGKLDGATNLSTLFDDTYDAATALSAQQAAALNAKLTGEQSLQSLRKLSRQSQRGLTRGASAADTTLTITETEAVNNGFLTVEYDPAELSFDEATVSAAYSSVHDDENGLIRIAYADLDAIPAGSDVAEISFISKICGESPALVTEKERNSAMNLSEDEILALAGLGHDFQPVETVAPTCTEEGYTLYRCSRCDAEELDDIIEALGHDFSVEPDPSDEDHFLAPTCTEEGLKYLKCSRCDVFSDEAIALPALGHAWGEAAYEWNGSDAEGWTVTATLICGNDPSHVITETVNADYAVIEEATASTDGLARFTASFQDEHFQTQTRDVILPATGENAPIEISDLEIRNNITLGAEFIINYRLVNNAAFKAYGFDSFWFEFIRHNLDGTTTTTLYGEGKDEALYANGSRSFDLKNDSVPAAEMGVTYEVIFHGMVGDQEYYTAPMTGSLKSFFVSQLESVQPEDYNGEARLRLAADSLLYAAKAQAKFNPDQGDLLADLSETALAKLNQYGTQEAPAAENHISYSDDGLVNPTIRLSLQSRLEVTVRYADPNAATPVVVEFWPEGNEAAKLSLPATLKSSTWSAVISEIGAAGVRDLYHFRVLANGVPVTNEAVWSVESYVAATRSSTDDAAMVDVLNAVLNFGDSVVNCFN